MVPNLFDIFKNSFRSKNETYLDKITPEDIDLIFKNKLFKCYLPKSVGGLGLSLSETLQIIEDAAYLNGSLGWLIQIGNGGMYFVSNFEEAKSKELFSPADAVIAGSGTPTTIAKIVEGGYRVSGSWKYCSGSDYATLFTLTFFPENSDRPLSAVVPRKDVSILNDWDTLGMRNTSTNTISVKDIFIPQENIFVVTERKSHFEDPILNLPFLIYAQSFFIHVIYGILNRMIVESECFLEDKRKQWEQTNRERVSKIEATLIKGKELLEISKNVTNTIAEKVAGTELFEKESLHFQKQFTDCAKEIRAYAHNLYAALGIEVLYRSHPIAICYADILSASQHKLLND